MAIRELKEGVKDKLTASKKGLKDLFRELVIDKINTPKKAILWTIVAGISVTTTWMSIREGREAKQRVQQLEDKVAQLEKKFSEGMALKKQFEPPAKVKEGPGVKPPGDSQPSRRPAYNFPFNSMPWHQ